MPKQRTPIADNFGAMVDARELPSECKPPYRGRTVGTGEHRGWRFIVRRIEGDPIPHVVISGFSAAGKYETHARRQEGATLASVRAWIDEMLSGRPGGDR